jgi:hypothetical protein
MDRYEFFQLLEGKGPRFPGLDRAQVAAQQAGKHGAGRFGQAVAGAKALGREHGVRGKHLKMAAGALGLGAAAMGARHVMKGRAAGRAAQAAQAAQATRSAAEAAKPMNRLKAAGRGALATLRGNPRRALAAGAAGAGLAGLTFLRRKDKKRR